MALKSLWEIKDNTAPTSDIAISFYRDALKTGHDYLITQFEQQIDITYIVHQRSHFVDQVLQHLWLSHIPSNTAVSLLAVGGYGRSELHPYSDVDLLVILDESVSKTPPESLSNFLTQLWDIGLDIGNSVRTIKECRQQAEKDITIATNLLETRLLCGEVTLYDELQQLTIDHKTWDAKRFYIEKKEEQHKRHLKYNDSANNLEPNIKEAPGGLRDLQVISWVAQQHFNVSGLQGLKQKGFLSTDEYNTLKSAQHFLWKIRFALHIEAKRKEEKLMINHQRNLAVQLGYVDNETRLAVEIFMKDYYLCARVVGKMNDLLLQLFAENIILVDEQPNISPINHRFQIHNGYLETINSSIFVFYPAAMLELFLILQQHAEIKGVRADTIRQLYAHLHLINNDFRADIKNRRLFMQLMRQPKGITHEFRRMNKYGVLGAYLPEFGVIVGQMQHDLFHIYTVDEHSLFLMRNLRRFACEEYKEEFPLCSQVYLEIPKTELLYIAGLYHDIAKGRGGDHSLLGVVDATAFCKRHELDAEETKIVTFIVRQHLTMSAVAQKCDINDPDVIKSFSAKVKTVDRLNYLYLLTVADIRATNNELWNSWRDSLLRQLYNATRQWLEHAHNVAHSIEEKSNLRKEQALQQLFYQNLSNTQVQQLWQGYDPDYFFRHTTDQIVWQTLARLQNISAPLLIKTREHNEKDTLEIFIFTEDKPRVFAAVTSCLEQLQLNILDAKISSTSQQNVLNTYIVSGAAYHKNEIIFKLSKQLADLNSVTPYDPAITPRTMKLFETAPTVSFKTAPQQAHTLLEIHTHDRPGLLSAIAQVFLYCDIDVRNAKLATLGDQVENIFIIANQQAQPLNDVQQDDLKQFLIDYLSHY